MEHTQEVDDLTQLQKLAYELATQDYELISALVKVRIDKGLTQEVVAERIGITLESIQEFEAHWSNPTLSTLRRYALAVGANYTHTIQALDGEQE